jgi:hypothetical protein
LKDALAVGPGGGIFVSVMCDEGEVFAGVLVHIVVHKLNDADSQDIDSKYLIEV